MRERDFPYIWVSTLSGLLSGEKSCEYAGWFKAHYQDYERLANDFDEAAWKEKHTQLLNRIGSDLRKREVKFLLENQNKFSWKGAAATIGGRPDLVALLTPREHEVYDAKTGRPKSSDIAQVKIGMWALPRATDRHAGATMSGRVVYKDREVEIPADCITKEFESNIVQLVKRLAAAQEAPAIPSGQECGWCDIEICKYRAGGSLAQGPYEEAPHGGVGPESQESPALVIDSSIVDPIDARPGVVSRIEGDLEVALSNLILPLGTFANDTPFDGLIYDCEIERGIPDGPREEDIEYCDGWEDYRNMGISTVCAYDYIEDAYRVFCFDNFEEFLALLSRRKWIIGFNSLKFDNNLIKEYVAIRFPLFHHQEAVLVAEDRTYDILQEIWRVEGLSPTFNYRTHGGYGLDAVCNATFGIRKTGTGAGAPADWQRKKVGKVIDYCLNDIRLTKRLMDSILAREPLVNPKRGGELILRHPED